VQINFGEAITLSAVIQAYFFIVGLAQKKSAMRMNEADDIEKNNLWFKREWGA
jgi:hypothetical protein